MEEDPILNLLTNTENPKHKRILDSQIDMEGIEHTLGLPTASESEKDVSHLPLFVSAEPIYHELDAIKECGKTNEFSDKRKKAMQEKDDIANSLPRRKERLWSQLPLKLKPTREQNGGRANAWSWGRTTNLLSLQEDSEDSLDRNSGLESPSNRSNGDPSSNKGVFVKPSADAFPYMDEDPDESYDLAYLEGFLSSGSYSDSEVSESEEQTRSEIPSPIVFSLHTEESVP
jgi:hypothetical protein